MTQTSGALWPASHTHSPMVPLHPPQARPPSPSLAGVFRPSQDGHTGHTQRPGFPPRVVVLPCWAGVLWGLAVGELVGELGTC